MRFGKEVWEMDSRFYDASYLFKDLLSFRKKSLSQSLPLLAQERSENWDQRGTTEGKLTAGPLLVPEQWVLAFI